MPPRKSKVSSKQSLSNSFKIGKNGPKGAKNQILAQKNKNNHINKPDIINLNEEHPDVMNEKHSMNAIKDNTVAVEGVLNLKDPKYVKAHDELLKNGKSERKYSSRQTTGAV
jgi:hypothetical protein